MKRTIKLFRSTFIPFIFLIILLSQPNAVAHSQTNTIKGIFHIASIEGPIDVSFSFDPQGGPMVFESGSASFDSSSDCYGTSSVSITGSFAGGDGGVASGTWTEDHYIECPDSKGTDTYLWTWSGNLHANGKGGGSTSSSIENDVGWSADYDAAEFQAALQPAITSEYIFTKYGIRVEDSFGGDKWDQKSWSDHEFSLLNDVLKELPPGFLNHIPLTRIVRNKVYIDANGNPIPGARGVESACDEKTDPQCTGSLITIRIFDSAATILNDFPNDPDKQFKSTILHEITHAYQAYKDGNSIYKDSNDSLLSENYKDATRPDTTLEAVRNGGWNHNGWGWVQGSGWHLFSAPGNEPPTKYGKTTPGEDMSDSVKMYVYDPQRLQTSSMARYNFIRDQMFGGIEYENGIQKKP